ncbi:MAG: hypothetical protein K0S65_2762 [Labilithrix sp.]|nr:hypothetical protein [Labilithrix sp.]
MKRRSYWHAAACVALYTAAPFACASERDRFAETNPGVFPEAGPDVSCAEGVRCSRDLRAVVSACDDSIVESCAPNEGCASGKCIPACEAAARSDISVGCEFAVPLPIHFGEFAGSCHAAIIANTWPTPARIEAEYAGKSLDLPLSGRIIRASGNGMTYDTLNGEIPAGEMAVLFLGQAALRPDGAAYWVPCPTGTKPALTEGTSMVSTTRGQSFQIKASVPVAVHSVYPFSGAQSFASSATLFLPVASWKSDYIVTDAWERDTGDPTTQILAAEDGTDVTVVSTVDIQPLGDVEGATKGIPHVYRMNRGEVLQFAQAQELSGSRISATKKVAVMGGHECLRIPTGRAACDGSQLQLFPTHSWGHEYVAVPHLSRRQDGMPENYFYRVVAAVDGTTLTYEPSKPQGAPATLSGAESARFTTGEPFVVRSEDADHPIAVYAYMSGFQVLEGASEDVAEGDPEFTYVIAAEQYLDRYVFFVDPSYRSSHLVVIRSRPPNGDFQPVTLDCAGPLDGWRPVGTEGKYEFTRIRLTRNHVHLPVGDRVCGPGRHEIDSAGPFNVTVWGTDAASSYAYPSGMGMRTLNSVPLPVH